MIKVAPERAWDFVSLSRELSELLGVRVDVVFERGLKAEHAGLLSEARPLGTTRPPTMESPTGTASGSSGLCEI